MDGCSVRRRGARAKQMQLLLLKHRPRSSGACLQALCRLHPQQGAVKTGRVTRRAVDLPPLEGLWGWQLGKVYGTVTPANTEAVQKVPHQLWADNTKGPAGLKVANYAHGEDAALDS